ncbi:PAS/PAC sensor signal transduction histidine kinase [Belliella buryatensis]|uniref:histidine kinase n=1 Tax=Belliella buryatensis TaxID=1500549 RepID=A0A239AGX1_9BACT|nr:histidine kinase N-terminal 7TM domain-containing protein [Belliella buryatensis]SNR94248.1 PAS/PAC sensor signal transduction histidine kinase [Belliella buryatensis]
MQLDFNIFSLTLLISGLLVAILSSVIIYRLNDYVRWFAITMLSVALWSIAYGFELASIRLEDMLFWIKIEYLGIAFAPGLWLWFCIKYVGLERWRNTNTLILVFFIPIMTYSIVLTNHLHQLHYAAVELVNTGPFPLLKITIGPWYYVHTTFFYVALLFGNILLFLRFKNTDPVFKKQTYTIIAGGVFPWLVNLFYLLGYRPFEHIDLTPYSFLLLYIIIGVGLLKFDLFDIKPIARAKVIQAMSTGVLVIDPRNRIIDFNTQVLDIMNQNKIKLVGKTVTELFNTNSQILETIELRQNQTLELKLDFGKGARVYKIDIIPLLDNKSIFSGTLIQFDDISEEKETSAQLIKQAEELKKLNELKDKLFSIISHDLKGPILGVRDLVKLTSNGIVSKDEFFEILPEVSKNMDSVSLLLENLLAWTSSQLRGEYIEKSQFDVAQLLKQEQVLFDSFAKEKNIKIQLDIQDQLFANADKNMIDLVVRNLLSNALKFSQAGDTVVVKASQIGNEISIKVKDTGTGISKENLEKLEKGESFTTSGRRNETGTGLGLILVRDYIQKNDGKFSIRSKENLGSEFEFTLPIYSNT